MTKDRGPADTPFPLDRGPASLLMLLLLILTFWHYIRVGFTDHDSMYAAIRVWYGGAFNDWTQAQAIRQGRIGHLYMNHFLAIPFLIKSVWWYKFVTIGALVLNTLILLFVVQRCFRSWVLGYLAATLYLASLCHSANHSLITGYFVYFHLLLAALMLALGAFHAFLTSGKRSYLLIATLLYVLTLGREDSPLYVVLFALMALVYYWEADGKLQLVKSLRVVMPLIAVSVAFVVVMIGYRIAHPTEYVGNSITLSEFSVVDYFHTLFKYTFSSLPGYLWAFDDTYAQLFRHYAEDSSGLGGLFQSLRVEWVVRAILVAYVVVLMAPLLPSCRRATYLRLGFAILILMLLPNAALSMSEHYQRLATEGRRTLTTYHYYVGFSTALLLVWAAAGCMNVARSIGGPIALRAVAVALAIGAAFSSVTMDYTNHHIVLGQEASNKKWISMDLFVRSDEFMSLEEDAVIYAPSLWRPTFVSDYYQITDFSGAHLVDLEPDEPNYWEKYFEVISGKRVTISDSTDVLTGLLRGDEVPNPPTYYLRYVSDEKGQNRFIVFARIGQIEAPDKRLLANEATLLSYARNRRFQVAFDSVDPAQPAYAGEVQLERHGSRVAGTVDHMSSDAAMPKTVLRAGSIDLDSITLSYYLP